MIETKKQTPRLMFAKGIWTNFYSLMRMLENKHDVRKTAYRKRGNKKGTSAGAALQKSSRLMHHIYFLRKVLNDATKANVLYAEVQAYCNNNVECVFDSIYKVLRQSEKKEKAKSVAQKLYNDYLYILTLKKDFKEYVANLVKEEINKHRKEETCQK